MPFKMRFLELIAHKTICPGKKYPLFKVFSISINIFMIFSFISGCQELRPAFADTASYYTYQSCIREGTSGVFTASGERYNENDLTCAMRSRDFGKRYKVTNLQNGKSVIVRHNDFGPSKKLWNKGRKIDLSKMAFKALAPLEKGIIRVSIKRLEKG